MPETYDIYVVADVEAMKSRCSDLEEIAGSLYRLAMRVWDGVPAAFIPADYGMSMNEAHDALAKLGIEVL